MKILIIGALPSSLVVFRGDFIKSMIGLGHEVIAMASSNEKPFGKEIENLGCKYRTFPIARNGLNIFSDIRTLCSLIKIFKEEKPDIVISYTIKPIVWAGIASRIVGNIKFYAIVTGLGFAFQPGNWKKGLLIKSVTNLYKIALKNSKGVIFQNMDNLNLFVKNKIVRIEQTHRVHGSGVNKEYYGQSDITCKNSTFLTVARLLGDKGLREYAKAASMVKKKYPNAKFQIVGFEDPSPDGIPMKEVEIWQEKKWIEFLGETDDVRPFIDDCSVFVLASYHEGLPRSVLEAMSMGRPILTTNAIGCKETVINSLNGFKVDVKDANALANRMIWFIEHQDESKLMGLESRKLVESKYDVTKVNLDILVILKLIKVNV